VIVYHIQATDTLFKQFDKRHTILG